MIRFVLAALLLVSACGQRLDHLGREPSFSSLPRSPLMVPRNPALDGQPPAPFVDRAYGVASAPAPRGGAILPAVHALPGGHGSLWTSAPGSLFGDRRASAVGDILTVVIDIDDSADISNATSRQRAGDESMSATAALGLEKIANSILPGNGLDPGLATTSSSTASGQGQVRRNEAIKMKVAARVMEVLPNGQLVITGRQEVRVNFELRDLHVVGIIRPEDISRDNEVGYDRMAEARISYGGRGHLSDVQQARYGQQVLDMISPF